jgi:hypothetical protein
MKAAFLSLSLQPGSAARWPTGNQRERECTLSGCSVRPLDGGTHLLMEQGPPAALGLLVEQLKDLLKRRFVAFKGSGVLTLGIVLDTLDANLQSRFQTWSRAHQVSCNTKSGKIPSKNFPSARAQFKRKDFKAEANSPFRTTTTH